MNVVSGIIFWTPSSSKLLNRKDEIIKKTSYYLLAKRYSVENDRAKHRKASNKEELIMQDRFVTQNNIVIMYKAEIKQKRYQRSSTRRGVFYY